MEIFKKIKNRYWIILEVIVLVWLGVLLFNAKSDLIYAKLNEWKLIPQKERFTELYFDNYPSLPREIVAGQPFDFSFAIRNLEGASTEYLYAVYLDSKNGRSVELGSGKVQIAEGETGKINVSYFIKTDSEGKKITVELTKPKQEISFNLGGK